MEKTEAQVALEKRLRSAATPWDRLPILIALTKELDSIDPDEMHRYATEALILARELKDPFWIACALKGISMQRMRMGQYAEAVDILQEAGTLFGQINDIRMKAEVEFVLARIYILTDKLDKAMEILLELQQYSRNLNDPRRTIGLLYAMGDVYRLTGDWNRGLRYYRKAIRIMERSGDRSLDWILYHRLAAVYRMMEDSPGYRRYMYLSLLASRQKSDKAGVAIALANIGNSYMDQQLFVQAEPYVRQSIRLYKELGYVSYEGMGWARLGTIYEHREEWRKAFGCFRKGLHLVRSTEKGLMAGLVYENFGRLCIKMGLMKRGLAYLHKGVAIINRSAQPNHQYKAYEELANAYEATGDAATALQYHRKSIAIKEGYLNTQTIREGAIVEMKNRYQAIKQKLKEERSQNNMLKKIIEEKEAELLSLTLAMVQNEEERSSTKRRGPTGRGAAPHKNRSAGLSENWETFARQFHKVHHEFYTKLVRQYPSLTVAEVKVCSLIRIGLSSTEIAGILCISRRTVDSHRVRIHKKMALPSGSSLAGVIACM